MSDKGLISAAVNTSAQTCLYACASPGIVHTVTQDPEYKENLYNSTIKNQITKSKGQRILINISPKICK